MPGGSRTSDVVVVGGGIVGLATAHRLRSEGLATTVVERGALGREASWAAAGYLTFQGSSTRPGPRLELTRTSFEMYPAWLAELAESAPGDTGFWRSGLLELCLDEAEEREARERAAWQRAAAHHAEWLDAADARRRHPRLAPDLPLRGALLLPEVAQVRPPRLLRVLAAAAVQRGVQVLEHAPVTAIQRAGERVAGVAIADGSRISAPIVVNAAGCWASQLAPEMAVMPIRPVKGTIVLLDVPAPPAREIVISSRGSLYPRTDHRVLVGATVEDAGYDTRVALGSVRTLVEQALSLFPSLETASLAGAWAGLRPFSHDNLPYLGPVPGLEGAYAATGHHRSGILLAPITARLLADVILGRPPVLPPAPYSVTRLLRAEEGAPGAAREIAAPPD